MSKIKTLFKRLIMAFRLWKRHNESNTKYLGFKKCFDDTQFVDIIDD